MRPQNTGQRKNEEPTSLPVPQSTERPPGRDIIIGFCLTALFFFLVWSTLSNFWHERSSPELQRGLTAVSEKQITEAQHFFESALRDQADDPATYLRILQQCQKYHEWNLMVQYAERGVQNCRYAPNQVRAALHASLSVGYLGQNMKKEALQQSGRALQLHPGDPTFLNHHGYLLADIGKPEQLKEAEVLIKSALDKLHTLPDSPEVQWQIATVEDSLGWVWYKQEKYQDAVRMLSQARERIPENTEGGDSLKEMYYHLGAAYHKAGRPGDALSMLDVSLYIDPNYAPAKSVKAEVYRQAAEWCCSPKLLPGPEMDTYSVLLASMSPAPAAPSP